MSKVTVPITQTIREGDVFINVNLKGLKNGEEVDIARAFGPVVGNPIAKGECVGCLGDEPANGRSAYTMKALKSYFKIQVKRIL